MNAVISVTSLVLSALAILGMIFLGPPQWTRKGVKTAAQTVVESHRPGEVRDVFESTSGNDDAAVGEFHRRDEGLAEALVIVGAQEIHKRKLIAGAEPLGKVVVVLDGSCLVVLRVVEERSVREQDSGVLDTNGTFPQIGDGQEPGPSVFVADADERNDDSPPIRAKGAKKLKQAQAKAAKGGDRNAVVPDKTKD